MKSQSYIKDLLNREAPKKASRYLSFYFLLHIVVSNPVLAGSFIFADEGIENIVTHPEGYNWNVSGVINVDVCIVPGSSNATAMQMPVENIVNSWNQQYAKTSNLVSGGSNDVPSNYIDFESVALHELGHCIGLAHPNAATESGLTGAAQNYTRASDGVDNTWNIAPGADGVIGSADDVRGDDGNLHWFRISNNNPFTLDAITDATTYARQLSSLPGGHLFAANASRELGALLGFANSEAVMQQGTFFDEAQRTLSFDDVATVQLGMSGVDMTEGSGDEYTINLRYQGISSSGCEINVSFNNAQTGFAVCGVSGSTIQFNPEHIRLTGADMYFNDTYNWYFNATSNAVDLSINVQANPDPVLAGTTLNYSIDVSNNSTIDADEVVVTDTLPAEVSFVVTSGCNEDPSGYPVCTLGSIAGGGIKQYSIFVAVDDAGSGSITNTATVSSVAHVDQDNNNNSVLSVSSVLSDTDGDGLSDSLELGICSSELDADSDDDGLSDGAEDSNANGVVDGGETSPCITDTDSDGIQDGTESGITTGIIDPDGAGPLSGTDNGIFIPDADPSSTTYPYDPDSDGDNYSDGAEDINANGAIDAGESDPNSLASIPDSGSVNLQVPLPGSILILMAGILFVIGYRNMRT